MSDKRSSAKNIDDYITDFPPDVQAVLQKMRATIHEAAPEATETISYAIPTFVYHGYLVHFAGFKNHVSLFPTGADLGPINEELAGYKTSKGTIQFPLNKEIPYDLISRIVRLRVEQNLEKAAAEGKKKT